MNALLSGNFQGLQHLGVPVSNLQRSREFYAMLGFREIMTGRFAVDAEEGQVAMVERAGVVLELYEMPESHSSEACARRDGRIDHIAFAVSDIDAAYTELRAAGIEPIEPEPVFLPFWEHGCRFFAVRGPDGEKVEFNQIVPH